MSQSAEAWTVARLLSWTREYFERSGLESPRLCAEILLAHAIQCKRLELYTRHELVPAAEQLGRFRESVKQAATGKPIAYLTGTKDFFSLSFEVTPDVLVPRPETEVLVERTIHLARARETPLRLLDLGCGSGCIAIALARQLPAATICASDISDAALTVARRNAARHEVESRIEFRGGDLLAPWSDAPPFDAIVSNPPYIGLREAAELSPGVRDFEPHAALFAGPDGLDVHRRLAVDARDHMADAGHLLVEVAWNQAAQVRDLLAAAAWTNIQTYRDDLRHERVVHARTAAASG
jgi:release factor glutamine methyltransferase